MNTLDIIKLLENYAPLNLQESWDNSGFLVGDEESSVRKILIALDATDLVIDEAIKLNADLIITHHPIIFKPIKAITNKTPVGKKILKLIKNNISVYSAHTNLDIALGGTNDVLFEKLSLSHKETLMPPPSDYEIGMGRIGTLKKTINLLDFCNYIKEKLNIPYVSFTGKTNTLIKRIGLCTGSSASPEFLLKAKEKNCDVYITGDITFHTAQFAEDLDLSLVDITHYFSEVIVCDTIRKYIKENFKDLIVETSKVNGQTLNII